jgi:hypothetical protein
MSAEPNKEPNDSKAHFPSLYKAIHTIWKRERSFTELIIHLSNALALMVVGHLLISFFTPEKISSLFNSLTPDILYYVLELVQPLHRQACMHQKYLPQEYRATCT